MGTVNKAPLSSANSSDVSTTPFQKTISATGGAFITSLVTTPLEVVKTRLQTVLRTNQPPAASNAVSPAVGKASVTTESLRSAVSSSSSSSSSSSPGSAFVHSAKGGGTRAPTTSSFATLIAVARMEGFRSLWSGLSAGLLMQIPSTVLYFTAYDELKYWLEQYGRTQRLRRIPLPTHPSPSPSPRSTLSTSSASNIPTLENEEHYFERYAPLISGILSRVLAVTIVSPLELLRTKAMYHGIDSPRLLTSIRNEISTGGYASLWRGLGPTLLRDVPFSGIYWYGYERIKKQIILRWYYGPYTLTRISSVDTMGASSSSTTTASSHYPSLSRQDFPSISSNESYNRFIHSSSFTSSNQWITSFLAGLFSGTFAAFITTPFDVVKTRKQVQMYRHQQQQLQPLSQSSLTSSSSVPISVPFPRTTHEILSTILKEEGLRGLFAGLNMRVARVGPACAIMISSYELGKYIFAHNRDSTDSLRNTHEASPLSSTAASSETDESMIAMNTVED